MTEAANLVDWAREKACQMRNHAEALKHIAPALLGAETTDADTWIGSAVLQRYEAQTAQKPGAVT